MIFWICTICYACVSCAWISPENIFCCESCCEALCGYLKKKAKKCGAFRVWTGGVIRPTGRCVKWVWPNYRISPSCVFNITFAPAINVEKVIKLYPKINGNCFKSMLQCDVFSFFSMFYFNLRYEHSF